MRLVERYEHAFGDTNARSMLRRTIQRMDKDFSQMMEDHDIASKAKTRVVVGHEGVAETEHVPENSTNHNDEDKVLAMDLLLRIANRVDQQAKATNRLHEKVNGLIKMTVSRILMHLAKH